MCTVQDGVNYFGVPRYFFRLSFTSGVRSVPVCYVEWIPFEVSKHNFNCFIGNIRQADWNRWPAPSIKPIVNPFIHLAQLLPSRWAFIEEPNPHATFIKVAFIVLDSDNLGEHVDDGFHNDFGDHKFPYFKQNKCSMQMESDSSDDEEEDEAPQLTHTLTEAHFLALKNHLPASVLEYLST